MTTIRLIKDWTEFKSSVEKYVQEATEVAERYRHARTEEEYNRLSEEYKEWHTKTLDYFSNSFDQSSNEYVKGFRYPQTSHFSIPGQKKSVSQHVREKIEDLNSLKHILEYNVQILSVSEAIIAPENVDFEARKKYSTDEKLELLLTRLLDLYSYSYHYSINNILEGNGVALERYDEPREFAKTLENYGLINVIYDNGDASARLTFEGKRHLENNPRSNVTDYSKINKSQEELNAKIDEIIDALKRQGAGQEILFEELEELKGLYKTLNKKNWGQVLKGKLIDLGLSQLISKEVMQEIFKELTSQVLSLK